MKNLHGQLEAIATESGRLGTLVEGLADDERPATFRRVLVQQAKIIGLMGGLLRDMAGEFDTLDRRLTDTGSERIGGQ